MSQRGSDRSSTKRRGRRLLPWVLLAVLLVTAADASAQATQDAKPSMEIYGFAMLDMGHDFTAINPNWSDTLRVTKLPSFDDQYGEGQQHLRGRPAEPSRRAHQYSDRHWKPEHNVRIRVVRDRRG